MRTYRILRTLDEDQYEFVADLEAPSASQAQSAAVRLHGDGAYIAIPERNWSTNGPGRLVSTVVFGDEDPEALGAADEPEEDDEPEDEAGELSVDPDSEIAGTLEAMDGEPGEAVQAEGDESGLDPIEPTKADLRKQALEADAT